MTNRITFTTIAATLLLAACGQDDTMPREALPAGEQAVCFSAGEPATRTEVGTNPDRTLAITWTEADEVGIYGRNDGRSSGDNYAYTASPYKSDATRCSFSASDTYELFTWAKNAAQNFYAYYPYAKVTDRTPNPEAHPFSLPALQTQSEGDSPAHIARYGLMTAAPVNIPAGTVSEGAIQFNFANVFSIVELRFKMTADCTLASVPVKQVRLLSDGVTLAIPAGTIDLTRAIDPETALPVVEEEESQSLTLTFDTNLGVTKTDYVSAYMVAAPGTHPAGTLRLEVTAIDNSTYSYTIPEQVTLRPNRHYTKSYELSLDEFVLSDEFEAEIPVLSCKVGEPLTVSMTGIADRVDFWSGEEGHDYAYAAKDRMQEADMTMHFMMLLNSGAQRHPAKVMYSTDFDGTMTEDGVLAANWTDVSDKFNMTHPVHGVDTGYPAANASTKPYDAGTADCTEWFSGEGNSCWIAFFYHVDKFDADYVDTETGTVGNGRTYFYMYDMWVRAQYKSESSYTEIYRQKYVDGSSDPSYPTFVQGSTFDSGDGTNPFRLFAYTGYSYVLRLGAAFRPTVDKDSYLIMPKLARPEAKNVGKDSPFVVKASDDEQPASYEYTFTAPGIYEVAVVGTVVTLGGEKQILLQKNITVTE